MGIFAAIGAFLAKAGSVIISAAKAIWTGIKSVGAFIGSKAAAIGSSVAAGAATIASSATIGTVAKAVVGAGTIIGAGVAAGVTIKSIIDRRNNKHAKMEKKNLTEFIGHRSVNKDQIVNSNPDMEDIYTTAVEKSSEKLVNSVEEDLEDLPKNKKERKVFLKKTMDYLKNFSKKVTNSWNRRASFVDDFADEFGLDDSFSNMSSRDKLIACGLSLGM